MPKKRNHLLFSLLSVIFPNSILPLQRLLTCYSKILCRTFTFPFKYEFTLSTDNGDNILWVKTFCTCQLKNALHSFLREYFFHESAIYLGYISTKLSIPKSCIKINRLFTFYRIKIFMVVGERPWFSDNSFRFVMLSGGIKREFEAIRGIWLNLKFS